MLVLGCRQNGVMLAQRSVALEKVRPSGTEGRRLMLVDVSRC